MRKFLFFIIFLAIIVGIFGLWYWQRNIWSKDKITLEIIAPQEVKLAQEVEYIVRYKNNSDTRLDEPELTFEYPSGSIIIGENPSRVIKGSSDLGDGIYPNEEKTFSFKARLLGKEGEAKIAKAALSYRPKNLKARYESSTDRTTIITSVPLSLQLLFPQNIEPSKEFRFTTSYLSSLDYSLSDVRIQAEYPNGFEFIESVPKSLEQTEWKIPVLNKSQSGSIEITGLLSSEINEIKEFRAKLVIWQEGKFVTLSEAEAKIQLAKPSIYLRQEINANPEYTALPGDWLHYEIYFKNIGEDALENLSLNCKLEGDAFDFQTIKSDRGISHAGDNSVSFDWKKIPTLKYLAPMDEGKVDFFIGLKDDLGNTKNPALLNKVFIGQLEQDFKTKISSKLEIIQKGYYQDDVFGNSGLPPTVGQTTTYTITWQVKNYYSDATDAKVTAVLPQGIELTGKIFPENETSKFVFDPNSRNIVWSVGDLIRGAGLLEVGPNISFQIAFTPTASQRGQSPDIITETKITAEDSWTGKTRDWPAVPFSYINISLPDDNTITEEMGKVK